MENKELEAAQQPLKVSPTEDTYQIQNLYKKLENAQMMIQDLQQRVTINEGKVKEQPSTLTEEYIAEEQEKATIAELARTRAIQSRERFNHNIYCDPVAARPKLGDNHIHGEEFVALDFFERADEKFKNSCSQEIHLLKEGRYHDLLALEVTKQNSFDTLYRRLFKGETTQLNNCQQDIQELAARFKQDRRFLV